MDLEVFMDYLLELTKHSLEGDLLLTLFIRVGVGRFIPCTLPHGLFLLVAPFFHEAHWWKWNGLFILLDGDPSDFFIVGSFFFNFLFLFFFITRDPLTIIGLT